MTHSLAHYLHLGLNHTDLPWLQSLHQEACLDFKRLGFPTRHHESWKYTRLDGFLALESLSLALDSVSVVDVPKGVMVMPLMQACYEHPEKIQPYLAQLLTHEHGLTAMNTALWNQGFFVYVPKGVQCTEPLWIRHHINHEQNFSVVRHLVVAEEGSTLQVIEDFNGDEAFSYATNTVTEVMLKPNAKVLHYRCQHEGMAAFHFGQTVAYQQQNSHFESHVLNVGGLWVRTDLTIKMQEPHAKCVLNGIYVAEGAQHMDHHTEVIHEVSDCESHQDYKGIANAHARVVFDGQVKVLRNAQRTKAHQSNKNLLLSNHAEVDTKPQLNIDADDVICTHGATVGQLDEDALFYLTTRGITRRDATHCLIQAFLHQNVQQLTHPALMTWMNEWLQTHLG